MYIITNMAVSATRYIPGFILGGGGQGVLLPPPLGYTYTVLCIHMQVKTCHYQLAMYVQDTHSHAALLVVCTCR